MDKNIFGYKNSQGKALIMTTIPLPDINKCKDCSDCLNRETEKDFIYMRGVIMSAGNSDWTLYTNNNNNKQVRINFNVGDTYENVSKSNNIEGFESIFDKVDTNRDGIIQQSEKDTLRKVFQVSINTVSGQVPMTSEECKELGVLDTSDKLEVDANEKKYLNGLTDKEVAQISELDDNSDYTYIINRPEDIQNADGTTNDPTLSKVYPKFKSVKKPVNNWSEGLDRHIDTINITADDGRQEFDVRAKQYHQLVSVLEQAGKDNGFVVRRILGTGEAHWLEDYSIRRADGKMLILSDEARGNINERFNQGVEDNTIDNIAKHRFNISTQVQGSVVLYTEQIAERMPDDGSVVRGNSYLEGGNVLNTCKADGTPAAVVGEESIDYTMLAMGLENSPQNVEKAKKQIAKDLGLKPENVTFMPQYDFHIDMLYRPLHNGQMAVPDYEASINILQNTQIAGMDDKTKSALIAKLKDMNQKTAKIRGRAEKTLTDNGYKIVKMPCFINGAPDDTSETQEDFAPYEAELADININYMNGVGGTGKNGKSFYITNDSGYPELNQAVQKYFEQAGVDKVYFAPASEYLKQNGGIDCITQEQPE